MANAKKFFSAAAGSAGGGDPVNIEDLFSTYLYEGVNVTNSTICHNTAFISSSEDQGETQIAWYFTGSSDLGSRSTTRNYYDDTDLLIYSAGSGGSGSGGHSAAIRGGVHYGATAAGTFVHQDNSASTGNTQNHFGEAITFAIGDVTDITEIADENLADFSSVTTIQSGDLIILYEYEDQALNQATLPTGFTEITYLSDTDNNLNTNSYKWSHRLAVKIADGTENGTNYGRNCLLSAGFPATRGVVLRPGTGSFNTASAMASSVLKSDNIFGGYQKIVNEIDLENEGGLVWFKNRDQLDSHQFYDTGRGTSKRLSSDNTAAEATAQGIKHFNSDGFVIGEAASINTGGENITSWTFRKAPRFFDVVTYTGDGSSTRAIPHSLGTTVGAVIVKRRDGAGQNWSVFHRSLTSGSRLLLQDNSGEGVSSAQSVTATSSSTFTVGGGGDVNASGGTYVAYLFAHNDGDGRFGPNGDQDVIKCGSFTEIGGSDVTVNLGFEPQWIMIKTKDTNGNWGIYDVMRGWNSGGDDIGLTANTTSAESNVGDRWLIHPDGFTWKNTSNSREIVYIAVRRGPMAVPTSRIDVFAQDNRDGLDQYDTYGWPVDFTLQKNDVLTTSAPWLASARLQGNFYLKTHLTDTESANNMRWDTQDGLGYGTNINDQDDWAWMWRRAPNFFDVVTYEGNGSTQNISHNLGVAPEMMWIKQRDITQRDWGVYHANLPSPNNTYLLLNNSSAVSATNNDIWNNTAPTDSVFSVGADGNTNMSGGNYMAYLFASLDGISKVGGYTGTGTTQDIDCGFSTGARLVIIRNASNGESWYMFDNLRGYSTGTDNYLTLEGAGAEVAGGDFLSTLSSGFTVNGSDSSRNQSGVTYVFYAIA
jgi:hypothetical protein